VSVALTIAIVIFSSVTAPLIVVHLTGRQRHREKEQDYARQDAVADEAARQQGAVREQAEEAARLLVENNRLVAEQGEVVTGKLDVIHTLVNSNMTAAMQSERDAIGRELAMMKEVIALREAAGQEPTQEALAALRSTESRIMELDANLADRLKQSESVRAQEGR
jgi:hypothetical protein